MKKTSKRIRLHRETLRVWSDERLSGAHGGATAGCPATQTCAITNGLGIACFNTTLGPPPHGPTV